MKLQSLALGLALALAGSAFAATTRDVAVPHDKPYGTMTRHIVRTSDHERHRDHHLRHVVVLHPQHHHHMSKVATYHPMHHEHHAANRTVVIHRHA